METETRQERILGRFSFRRGRKNPQYISVIAYTVKSNETDGKPYSIKDSDGKPFKLLTRERIEVERNIREIGTADAADLRAIKTQAKIAQDRSKQN